VWRVLVGVFSGLLIWPLVCGVAVGRVICYGFATDLLRICYGLTVVVSNQPFLFLQHVFNGRDVLGVRYLDLAVTYDC